MSPGLPPAPTDLGLAAEAIVALPAAAQTLYRLLRGPEPRPADFRSNRERGRPPAPRESVLLHCGVSLFSTPQAALARARRTPAHLAVVTLAPSRGLYVARTAGPGHYTVWGEPERLAACARPYHSSGDEL